MLVVDPARTHDFEFFVVSFIFLNQKMLHCLQLQNKVVSKKKKLQNKVKKKQNWCGY